MLAVDVGVTATISGLTITGGGGIDVLPDGGGILNQGVLSVANSTIVGNSAESGGGIRNDGTLSVTNSTISGNSGDSNGGGIYNALGGTLSVTHSTIVGNAADADDNTVGYGGGIYTDGGGSTALHHTIVAGNLRGSAESEPDDLSGLVATASYNLVGDKRSSGGLVSGQNGNIVGVADLSWLAPLDDYGGITKTHALLPGSPAIDAGDPGFDPPPLTDQRGEGFARIVGGGVDIGSFEHQESFVVTMLLDEDDGDLRAGDLSLREALGLATSNPGFTVEFAPSLAGGTIALSADLGPLLISGDLELLGMGVTLNAAGHCRVLFIDAGATATISDLTITGGLADYGGGILNQGGLSVANSTISDNSANVHGGGIANEGTLLVVNSTISGNSANTSGGGVFNDGELSVVNSTIVENTADADDVAGGGGGGVDSFDGSSTTLHNTIVAGNVAGTIGRAANDLVGTVGEDHSYNNLIGDASTAGGLAHGVNGNIVGVEDLSWLAPLGDYGGPTQTHALSPGSAAIDAGDPDFGPNAFDPPFQPISGGSRASLMVTAMASPASTSGRLSTNSPLSLQRLWTKTTETCVWAT